MDKSVVVSGSGGHLNIEVVIDGILGTSIIGTPTVINVTAPPLSGGTMQIVGKDFAARGLAINVYENGCSRALFKHSNGFFY